MKRRNDYKVAMAESVELEPLGGMDKLSETDSKKRNGINKFGKQPVSQSSTHSAPHHHRPSQLLLLFPPPPECAANVGSFICSPSSKFFYF